jgi:hypothetical protein
VNGHRVQHAVLGDGSVVQIGTTHIKVHVSGGPTRVPPPAAEPRTPRQRSSDQPAAPNPEARPQTPPPNPPGAAADDPRRQHWSG